MNAMTRTALRAVSLIEALIAMVITAAVVTAGFSLITSLAAGDQAVPVAVALTEETIRTELRNDLKNAIDCSATTPAADLTPVVSVEPGSLGVEVFTIDISRDLTSVVWKFNSETRELLRHTYDVNPGTCVRYASPATSAVMAEEVTGASFSSNGSDVSLQAQISVSGTSKLVDLVISS